MPGTGIWRPACKTRQEAPMKLTDLIDMFVDREIAPPPSSASSLNGERTDTSSLADIARILRELDGQYEADREAGGTGEPRRDERLLRS
jgi:hypothetical protein